MPNSILLGFSAPNTTETNESTSAFDRATSPEMQPRKLEARPELSKQAQYSRSFPDGSQPIIENTSFESRTGELEKEPSTTMDSAQQNSLDHEADTMNGQVIAENGGGNGYQSTFQSQVGGYVTPYAPVLPFIPHPGTGGFLPAKTQLKGDEESPLNSEPRMLTTPSIPSHVPLSRQSSFGSPSLFGSSIQGAAFGEFGEQQADSWRSLGIHSPPSSISEPKEFEGPGLNQYAGSLDHSGSTSSSSRSSGYSARSKTLSYSGLKSASMSKFPSPGGVIPGLNKGLTPTNTANIVSHTGSFQAPRRTNSVSKWMSKADKRNRRRWTQGIRPSEELYDVEQTDGLEPVSFSRPYHNQWDSKSDIYSEKMAVLPASSVEQSSGPPVETNGVMTPYSDQTPVPSMEDASYYTTHNGSNGTTVPFSESAHNRDATTQRWPDPYYSSYASRPYVFANYPSFFAEQQQRLAAQTAYKNFIPGAPLANVPVEPTTIHPHPGDQSQAILHIEGDLFEMTRDWTMEETKLGRRLVRFEREQRGRVIYLQFEPINPRDYREDMCVISCIWRRETQEYYVTSVNCIALLELIVNQKFSVEEKNRIRRNLEVCKPLTVSKTKSEVASFFRQIMGFTQPRPRNIEKDVKVFLWSTLESALKKIVSKYSAS